MEQKITILLVDNHPLLVVILLTAFLIQGCTGMPLAPNGSSDPQPTNAPGVFTLLPYKPLVMEYDPSKWSDKSEYENTVQMVNYLESRTIKACRVGPVGPSGFFPDTMEPVQLGGVRYTTTTVSDPATGLVIGYYFENQSLEGFDYEMGIAVITIQAHPDEWDACKTSGEDVLSTLHAPEKVSLYSYAWLSQEERISRTDLIVETTVTGISAFESVTANGVTIHAGNYRLETREEINMLAIDVCYDMLDASDWLPEKVSFVDTRGLEVSPQYLSVIEIRYPPQLVDGKMQQLVTDGNRDRYQDAVPGQEIGQRCDTLHAVLPEGFDTSSFIITIHSIARNPSEPDVCGPLDGGDSEYLKKIQSALDEQKTGIKIKHKWEKGEEGGTCGLEIIQKPNKMSESEARAIIHDEKMFTDLFGVRGPWVFKGSVK